MRDPTDDFTDVDFAQQEVHGIEIDGYGDKLEEIVHFYHAEQVRNVAEQLSRIADAMEESEE